MAKYTDRDIEELVELIKRRKGGVSILTGAGCSLSAGIPLAATLVKEINQKHSYAICRHIKDEARRGDYGACMGALPVKDRKAILEPYLEGARINWAHIALAALMRAGHVRRVLTFNFDSVLARACGLLGVYPATYDFGVSPSERSDYLAEPCIVHLHGQGYGPVMMNTEKETTDHAKKIQPLFKDTLEEGPLLVIGYSGEADQVFPVLKETYANKESLFWLGYSDEPKQHLRALLDDHSGCCYFGGADADEVLIALARRLDCFPPQVFADPAAHLLSEIEAVAAFPLDKTSEKIDLLESTRVRLAEHGPRLRLTQGTTSAFQGNAEAILAATEAGTQGADDERENASPELIAWAHFSKGTDLLVSSEEAGSFDDLKRAIVEFENAAALKPDMHEALCNWGTALSDLAKLNNDEALYRAACEKYVRALAIKPDLHEALNNWGNALSSLADLKGDEGLYRESYEKYAEALIVKPDKHEALYNWGNALTGLAKLKSDEDLYRESFEKYAQALAIKPSMDEALNNWGNALLHQWRLSHDDNLLAEAGRILDRHEALAPSDPYNRACVAALLGDEEGCRTRLLRAKGAGTLPSKEHLIEDEDLSPMRDKSWFKALLDDCTA